MITQPVGTSPLVTSRLAYGCMRLPSDLDRARAAVLAAYEAGYTLFDHADIYGRGDCERVFGDILRDTASIRRDDLLLATKCGIRFANDPPGAPHRYDLSEEHVVWSCEQSLKRLRVDTIDIYQLHRPDLLLPPDEVAAAFTALHRAGKVRYFGVSNFPPSLVRCLQSAIEAPLVVQQVEIHLGRLACFEDGTLDQCLERRMTPLAWSPLGGGWLGTGGAVAEDHPRREHLVSIQRAVDAMAASYGISRTALALAWLLKHPAGIIPIVGSCRPDHIRDAASAADVSLSREDWYRLYTAARGASLP